MFRVGPLTAAAASLAAVLGLPIAANAASVEVDYDVSLAGLTIGSARVAADVGSSYQVKVQAKMTGLVGAMTSGKGAATSSGILGASARPLSRGYAVSSRAGSDERAVRVAMTSGQVEAAEILPPLEEKPDRVPAAEAHKRDVVDPVSAFLMPVAGSGPLTAPSACERVLPIYDGAARFDIVLSFREVTAIKAETGYNGPALVCSARYKPISGHRPLRKATRFMSDNRDMHVVLVPLEGTRVLVPYRVSIKTMIGTAVLETKRFAVAGASGPGGAEMVKASAQR